MSLIAAVSACTLGGCRSPLDRSTADELRQARIAAQIARFELRPAASGDRADDEGTVETADAGTHAEGDLIHGDEAEPETFALSLRQALLLAAEFNLDVAIQRLGPAVADEQRLRAEAAFDPVFFGETNWTRADTPQPPGTVPGLTGDRRTEVFETLGGIRQPLTTGGELFVQSNLRRQREDPSVFAVERFYQAGVEVGLRHPLLRGAGTEVTRARIVLAANLQEAEAHRLREELINLAGGVEQAYWQLVLAWQRKTIQQRLLERTLDERERVEQRVELDVTPIRRTEVASVVELRRADLARARLEVRLASDALKDLINAPGLSVMADMLIRPLDAAEMRRVPVELDEAVHTAVRQRPDLQIALLEIDDATVRHRVAERGRLPVLDAVAQVGLAGLDERDAGRAYRDLRHADYFDYRLGLQVELPLGNRGANALARQSRLQRQQASIAYNRQVQAVIAEVRRAMRELHTAGEMIVIARAARRAAAENLRAIEEQEDAGVVLTPEFLLDLKLGAQQRLADAEVREARALSDHRAALARLQQAMGGSFDDHRIDVIEPGQSHRRSDDNARER